MADNFLDTMRTQSKMRRGKKCPFMKKSQLKETRNIFGLKKSNQPSRSKKEFNKYMNLICDDAFYMNELPNQENDDGDYMFNRYFRYAAKKSTRDNKLQLKSFFTEAQSHMFSVHLNNIKYEFLKTNENVSKEDAFKLENNQKNGTLLQKFIEAGTIDDVKIIWNCLKPSLVEYATSEPGYWVIRKLLKKCADTERTQILECILDNWSTITDKPFGNYLIQYILDVRRFIDKSIIIDKIFEECSNFVISTKLKWDLLNKCVSNAAESQLQVLIGAILMPISEKTLVLHRLCRDKYGNYFVSHLLNVLKGEQLKLLIAKILGRKKSLKNDIYGRYVITKIKGLKNDVLIN